MSESIEPLIGFSEFALALAGFAAIALVLGRREEVFPAGSAYVVQFMVLNSLGPAMLGSCAAMTSTHASAATTGHHHSRLQLDRVTMPGM